MKLFGSEWKMLILPAIGRTLLLAPWGFETKSGQSWKVPLHPRLRKMLGNSRPHGKTGWFFTAQPSRKYPDGAHHIYPKHANEDFIKVLKRSAFRQVAMSGSRSTACGAVFIKQFPLTLACHGKLLTSGRIIPHTRNESKRLLQVE